MAAQQRTPLESTKVQVVPSQRRRESVADGVPINEMIARVVLLHLHTRLLVTIPLS